MISNRRQADGKYLVSRRLGGGGYGEVFLADDEGIPGRQVAIKILSNAGRGDHADLLWEMAALAQPITPMSSCSFTTSSMLTAFIW